MPERRRSGTAKVNALTSAIADVAPVEERPTPPAQSRLTAGDKHERGLFRRIASGAIRHESSPVHAQVHALGAAGWLSLAAAPTFAIMALLTAWVAARRTCSARPRMKRHR